jgi:hypothetical protein
VDHIKGAGGRARFIRLEVAYQVPSQVVSFDLVDFIQSFLHAVFAEVARARLDGLLNRGRVECFRYYDQGYLIGVSAGALGRSRYTLTHAREPLSNLFGHREEILSAQPAVGQAASQG